jgi:cyclohexanone monooxygenase
MRPEPAALRQKYRDERDKRLAASRADIADLAGSLARYLDDPHTPRAERSPVRDEVDVLVVGAGLGGLIASVQLRKAGVTGTRLVDSAGDVGGVWYWNRYPGAMCDVESLVYMPLLEELGYIPRDHYAKASEILAHAQAIAKRYALYEDALFHTKVTGIRWHAARARWLVSTDRDDLIRARFVILANGPLSMPRLPAVPGISSMSCHSFHTSRWDYGYTGGDADSPLDKLDGKVVGVVGTGATAIQCIPPLGASAERLYVFQRTPSTVAVRGNRPVDRAEVLSWAPGWQWRRIENFTAVLNGLPVEADLVSDGWTDIYRDVLYRPEFAQLEAASRAAAMRAADFAKMEAVRRRVSEIVTDAATAEALQPYYDYFCKRPCFHDEYLATFNRDNVTLVDTAGRGIEEISGDVVRVGRDGYRVDCLIFATGFEWNTPYTHKIGFDSIGRRGLALSEKWADGMATLHGLMTHGFPNLFTMAGPNGQSVVTENFGHSIQENGRHVAYIVSETLRRGYRTVEVSAQAEADWVALILDRRRDDAAFLESCTPGRGNSEGRPDDRPRRNANFGGTAPEFFALLAAWRADGSLPGLILGR